MKDYIHYISGYCGYFLLTLVSVRFLRVNDMTAFSMSLIALLLLIIYVEFMEKKSGKPKYSGLITFVLSVVFLLASMDYISDLV